MLVTIYQSERVSIGAPAYAKAKAQAESIAQQQRAVGCGGCVVWHDEYNDYSALGRFTVTARVVAKAGA